VHVHDARLRAVYYLNDNGDSPLLCDDDELVSRGVVLFRDLLVRDDGLLHASGDVPHVRDGVLRGGDYDV